MTEAERQMMNTIHMYGLIFSLESDAQAIMTNNERFNALLNSCQRPRAVYNAFYTLAPGKTDRVQE